MSVDEAGSLIPGSNSIHALIKGALCFESQKMCSPKAFSGWRERRYDADNSGVREPLPKSLVFLPR